MDMEKTDEEKNGSALVLMPKKSTTDDYSDDVNDPFICLICLDLVHKPVVNACGHMFCFLCVHLAMNQGSESYCPLCRRQYMHFPRICEQLHFFLLQALPDAYRRRCKEAQAEEVQANVISPQFDDGLQFYLNNGRDGDTSASFSDEGKQSVLVASPLITEEHGWHVGSKETSNGNHTGTSSSSSNQPKPEQSRQLEVRSADCEIENGVSSSSTSITTSGLLCSLCKDLLCRPVVLNCGHVFCEGCAANSDGAQDSVLKCSVCGSFHPGPFPSVFLELHHYLDKTFPSEYAIRQREMDLKAAEHEKCFNNIKQSVQPSNKQGEEPKFTSQGIHVGVGCDGCGIYPMMGRRFKCQQCGRIPGYDLCLNCYETQTILMGRFNQKHTREHQMVEVSPYHHLAMLSSDIDYLGEDVEDIDFSDVIEDEITIIWENSDLELPTPLSSV